MKTGKEIKINDFKNYNIVFGSVNNKHPKAVYVNITAWAEPTKESDVNYGKVIKETNKNLKQLLYKTFELDTNTDFLKDRTIIDLDIRESGIRFGKRSFISCEVTLFLDIELPITSEIMLEKLNDVTKLIIYDTFEKNEFFKFYKKK